jgi:hypothetical protein
MSAQGPDGRDTGQGAVVELRRFSKWYGDVVAVADRRSSCGRG